LTENKIFNIEDITKVLPESSEIIDRNYRLMQLQEVDISGSTKSRILQKIRQPINRLVKFKFETMFLEDKLFTALPNLNSWLLTNFSKLNNYAEKSNK